MFFEEDDDDENLIFTNKNRKSNIVISTNPLFYYWYDANIMLPRWVKKYWGVEILINAENSNDLLCLFIDFFAIKNKIPKEYRELFRYVYCEFAEWVFKELKLIKIRINMYRKLTNDEKIEINKAYVESEIKKWEKTQNKLLIDIFLYAFLKVTPKK